MDARSLLKKLSPPLLLALAAACGGGGGGGDPEDTVVVSVEVAPEHAEIDEGKTLQLTATAKNAAGQAIKSAQPNWVSSDRKVATVDPTGLVKALAAGDAELRATVDGFSATAHVVVNRGHVASVVITTQASELGLGRTVQFEAEARDAGGMVLQGRTARWTTSDASVLDIDENGLAKARALGRADITAEVEGARAEIHVAVVEATVAVVRVTPKNPQIPEGKSQQLSVTYLDGDGNEVEWQGTVSWSSSDVGTATVSPSGLVTAVKLGQAEISASAAGKTGKTAVEVVPGGVAGIKIVGAEILVTTGEATGVEAYAIDDMGHELERPLTWESSDPNIVSVDANGRVSGLKTGETQLIARYGDVSQSVPVRSVFRVATVAAGERHSCGLTPIGRVVCFGSNDQKQLGSERASGESVAAVAVDFAPEMRFSAVYAGGSHSCALTDEGEAWCWGSNASGQLGTGGTPSTAVRPVKVMTPDSLQDPLLFDQLTLGAEHTCGIRKGSFSAFCWGNSANGRLGHTATPSSIPGFVSGPSITKVKAGGAHTCGIGPSGIHCWGKSDAGQAGAGGDATTPRLVVGGSFIDIALGANHSCAIAQDRQVMCWGANDFGQLGNGTVTSTSTPGPISMSSSFRDLTAGNGFTCAVGMIGADASVAFCWGDNRETQLGYAGTTGNRAPNPVNGTVQFDGISAGGSHVCGLSGSRTYCWGRATEGQTGWRTSDGAGPHLVDGQ
ncbi:Ig-like domain-containing protein [Vulgatibacter incomptus]|uniref:BNR repeat domain protein n=1 Tax=Vulgatibacter incomptus TaxID=1391653 RepID=A0A0K1PG21_9BACT|nr:Ig-like domain-containing protein [Vulgatibacter incomptus]AKU92059.1 BNR repeat domain protein [Vulgatibacter incomptus]